MDLKLETTILEILLFRPEQIQSYKLQRINAASRANERAADFIQRRIFCREKGEDFLLLQHFSLQRRIFWSRAQTAGVRGKLVWPKVFIKMMDRLAAPIILLPFSTTQPPQPPPQALPSCCQSVFGCFFRVLGVVMT